MRGAMNAAAGMAETITAASSGSMRQPSTSSSTSRNNAAVRAADSSVSASQCRHVRASGRGLRRRRGGLPQRQQRREGDRRLQQEDPLPAGQLRQRTAGGRTDGGARDPGRGPRPRGLGVAVARGEQLERGAHQRGAADRLDAAGGEQQVERAGQAAGGRGDAEHDDPAARRPAAARAGPGRRPARRRARGSRCTTSGRATPRRSRRRTAAGCRAARA